MKADINSLVERWKLAQSAAAEAELAGDSVKAHSLYEEAGDLEESISAACTLTGLKQIRLRRRERGVPYAD